METKITILGQTVSQKNSKNIAMNRSTGKPFIMSNKGVKEWQTQAGLQLLRYRIKQPYLERVEVSMMFYVKDNRRRDPENMASSVLDALVHAHIIVDDDWQHVRIGYLDAEIDRENPRVEITIKPIAQKQPTSHVG